MAKLIDGKTFASHMRTDIAQEVLDLKEKGIEPGLALIIVGKDMLAHMFVRNKHRACVGVGIHSVLHKLSGETTEQELFSLIDRLNNDSSIHGIHIQQPLPEYLSMERLNERISPNKDAAGANPVNVGKICLGVDNATKPFLASSILALLDAYKIELDKKNCIVIGNENIIIKPMMLMLMLRGATTVNCPVDSPDLQYYTKKADVIIAAAGVKSYLTADMIKENVAIIDVGGGHLADGTRFGDVDFDSVFKKASYINPVPGNIGPISATLLLRNTLDSIYLSMKQNQIIIDNTMEE